jgi:hypothetical protein
VVALGGPHGPVSPTVNLFYMFFFSKIILKILENPRMPYFHKNTPELFQNSILVPIILHLGPCLTFIITVRSFS